MNNSRIVLIVMILVVASFAATRLSTQKKREFIKEPTNQEVWTEEEAKYWIQQNIKGFEESGRNPIGITGILGTLYKAEETLTSLENPDELIQVILDSPYENDEIIAAKIEILSPYRTHPGVYEFVCDASSIEDESILRSAAKAFLEWGEWEKAFPLITKCEQYWILNTYKNDKDRFVTLAIPFLEEATREASWRGRIYAAQMLQVNGDSATIKEVAVDIVRNSLLYDDEKLSIAQSMALSEVMNSNISIISDITRLADSESQRVRNFTLFVLGHFMRNGNDSARIAIEKIAEENEDAELRGMAKEKLLLYEQGLE